MVTRARRHVAVGHRPRGRVASLVTFGLVVLVLVVFVSVALGHRASPARERMGWLSPNPAYKQVDYAPYLGAAGSGVWPNAFAPPQAYDVDGAMPTQEVANYTQSHSEEYAPVGGPYQSYRYANVAWSTSGWPRDALAPALAEEPNWECAGDARRHCMLSDGRPGKCVHNGYCAPVMLAET